MTNMFNANAVVIKQPLKMMSTLRFAGSRLITDARYVSGWSFPRLGELYRRRAHSSPLAIQPAGQLLLSRLGNEYQVLDTTHGELVSVCPVEGDPTRLPGRQALSACGRFVILGERRAIRVREMGSGRVVWQREIESAELAEIWPLHGGTRWAFCIAPIHQGGNRPIPMSIEVWDWPLGSQPRSILERDSVDVGTSVSDTGLIAFPGFRSRPIGIFDLESGRVVREFEPPEGNASPGYAHWLSGDRLGLAWWEVLIVTNLDASVRREFFVPTYSPYSVAATDEFLALSYHDGFVMVPLDQLPVAAMNIEISPPWQDPPEPEHDNADFSFVTPEPSSYRSVVGETVDELRSALKEFERPAWIPRVCFRAGEITASKLGGTPWLSEVEEWPCCGVCSQPMELFLQLNSADLPSELADRFSGLVQVFLCVTNGYSSGTCALGYEGFSKASMLRLCQPVGRPRYQAPPFADAFIEGVIESWQPRQDLPSRQETVAMGIELTDAQGGLMIDHSVQFAAAGDKLGGWPDWPQNLDYIACPRCKGRMDVIFQIRSDHTLPHNFMDGGTAWVSQCREHPEVLALNWNS